MNKTTKSLADVRDYWNIEACGSHFVKDSIDKEDFYTKYQEYRYRVEWHILELIQFDLYSNQDVLEIGCGNGIDGSMFARNGANYTGVDLTEAAVDSTRGLFELRKLNGTFMVENAERLSFAEKSFDLVYSHGVIHHSPQPELIVEEIYRVLRPGGAVIAMLYHRISFNYLFRILIYMRVRLLLKILIRLPFRRQDRTTLMVNRSSFISNVDGRLLDAHYSNFLEDGWSYLKAENFVHRCTDGPDCPYARVYSKNEIGKLFSQFEISKMKVAHLPLRNSRIGRLVPMSVEKWLAERVGFYLFIFGEKPSQDRVAG